MPRFLWAIFLCSFSLLSLPLTASQTETPAENKDELEEAKADISWILDIDGRKVAESEFRRILTAGVKDKYFHGYVREDEIETFVRSKAEELLVRYLVIDEARIRKVQYDKEWFAKMQADYVDQLETLQLDEDIQKEAVRVFSADLEGAGLFNAMKKQVMSPPENLGVLLEQYYKEHLDLFREPIRRKVSIILLRVEPSAGAEGWKSAEKEAQDIYDKIGNGADFAELARIHSADESASDGGDMGYIHEGMLATPVEDLLETMQVGDLAKPLQVLTGYIIVRLDDVTDSKQRKFADVKDRATELFLREYEEKSWNDFVDSLKQKTPHKVNEALIQVAIENAPRR